ncbi:MAG: DUF192 domain-containing protein [Dehalococcoidia bacterium]|nr:DUF192 domain-containing protein [Dehalococcoidia bacterium]
MTRLASLASRTSTHLRARLAGVALLAAAVAGCVSSAPAPASTPAAAAPAASGAPAAAGAPASSTPTAEPVASTAALPDSALPRVRFLPASGTAATLPIEVPPDTEYGIGLSGRKTLVERGMLFYFPQTADVPFWMQGTHIDLDIAFVDRALKVVTVTTMKADTQDYHRSAAPFIAAIEAPAGWYAAHGVRTGATVVFDFDLKAVTGR